MGHWIERSTDANSVGIGPIVQGNPDRYSLYLVNLTSGLRHVAPMPLPQNSVNGIPIPSQGYLNLVWERDGNLCRATWMCPDGQGGDEWYIVEGIYYDESTAAADDGT